MQVTVPLSQGRNKRRKSQERVWCFHNKRHFLKGNAWWNPNLSESNKLNSLKRKRINDSCRFAVASWNWTPLSAHTVRTWVCSQKHRWGLVCERPWSPSEPDQHGPPSSLSSPAKWNLLSQTTVNKQNHLASNVTWIHGKSIDFYTEEASEMTWRDQSRIQYTETWEPEGHKATRISFNATDLFMSSLLSKLFWGKSQNCG